MTEAELLGLISRVAGISQQADEQTAQPDSMTADNYVRVVVEVMRRDGIQLNDVDMRNIRIRVLEMLAYNRRVELYREKEKITYHWKKPERLRR
ncbi:hypothetical protein ACI7KQ_000092 [Escherichia coli]|uniref:hypothetical protein n=1 Tax=Escherichia coli TaxID=562 RepID=UPI000BE5214E|nr:hypothetical protein [Escherichia coli]EJK1446979.1 hypothetical protein [Escherichia coli]EKK1989814.1 hypothetical protein [Escherichia coli]MBB7515111.1 hypothetical protein [Escherichia coli]HBQ4150886.1 hypothetical protein [Escherichia coli]HBQ4490752.1 hypothetical protein [Escherichia coli]